MSLTKDTVYSITKQFKSQASRDRASTKSNFQVTVHRQECAKLRIPWENVQLEKQKSICEANFAWIFACCWNGVNSNYSVVTIHGLADKENPAVIDSGVFAWLIEVPVYF